MNDGVLWALGGLLAGVALRSIAVLKGRNHGQLRTLLERLVKEIPSISVDPEIMEGQPCVAGTRIPVSAVLRVVEQYGSLSDVIMCYPQLTRKQASDALYFAQMLLRPDEGEDE